MPRTKAAPETLDGLVRPGRGCWFDPKAADRVVDFFGHLRHSKGEWAGQPFTPRRWQRRIMRAAFGWKRADQTRMIRRLYLEIPRKNGKSTFASGGALYLTVGDGEPVAEVYGAASDEDQARICFDEAGRMVHSSPDLSEVCEVFRTSIFVPDTASSYKPVSKAPETKHGFSPHGTVIDELHAFKSRELYDVLTSGQGARRQPMTIIITTAGYDRNSICWELHDYAIKCRDGIISDPSFLGVIYAADEGDDWHDEKVWKKANPNLGVSVKLSFLRDEHRAACASPARENTFKRLYLNMWTEQESRWLPMDAWDRCAGPAITEVDLRGRRCWGGLDLSNTSDIASLVYVFPVEPAEAILRGWGGGDGGTIYAVLPRFFLPADSADKRLRNNRVPYPTWAQQGLITLTPGNVIDHERIREQVLKDFGEFSIQEIAYDPWNAIQLCSRLHGEDGVPMIEHRQGFASMAAPTKAMEAAVLGVRLWHGGHPIMRWAASNVVVSQDAAGNIKPNKAKAFEKIDPIVSLIMALGRASISGGGSVYEGRGLLDLDGGGAPAADADDAGS